jgi:hypothetical protein
MDCTRNTKGHEQARAVAVAIAAFRAAGAEGMAELPSLPWSLVHSLSWRSGGSGSTVVAEVMDVRRPDGERRLLRGAVGPQGPTGRALDHAVARLRDVVGEAVPIEVRVMVAYPGWDVRTEPDAGDDAPARNWCAEESLALTSAEWPDFIVQRDADERERGMYAANSLLRASIALDRSVSGHPDGYHRHWTRVDAEILRRAALREHPSLDPGFATSLNLVA